MKKNHRVAVPEEHEIFLINLTRKDFLRYIKEMDVVCEFVEEYDEK